MTFNYFLKILKKKIFFLNYFEREKHRLAPFCIHPPTGEWAWILGIESMTFLVHEIMLIQLSRTGQGKIKWLLINPVLLGEESGYFHYTYCT